MRRPGRLNFNIVCVLFCYAAALSLSLWPSTGIGTKVGNIRMQTLALMAGCIISALGLLPARRHIVKAALLILISIQTLVTGGLQGRDMSLEVLMFAALNALLVNAYPPGVNLPAALLVVSASVATRRDMLVLGTWVEGPEIETILFFVLIQAFLLLLLNRIRAGRGREDRLCSDLNARERTIAYLTDANRDFQKFAIDLEEESRVDERKRITRDLHDITGYTMTGVSMLLEHAQDLLSVSRYDELNTLLDTAKTQTRKGQDEIRRSLRKLRSMDNNVNFNSAVLQIVHNFSSATGVSVNVDFTNMSVKLGRFGRMVIFRFLQEGLTNAFRHGKAERVSIMFFQEEHSLVVSLEDNGRGADVIEEGIGLKGMGERISKLKGAVDYSSTSLGFTLRARIPLEPLRMRPDGE